VPYTQSLHFFTDLQEMGVPSRLLVFKNDGHWPDPLKSMPAYYNAHLEWFQSGWRRARPLVDGAAGPEHGLGGKEVGSGRPSRSAIGFLGRCRNYPAKEIWNYIIFQ